MAIQLQAFARQVLFGTSIEEKLSFPREEIIDTQPGNAIKTPRTLPRPPQLALREKGVRAEHPSQTKLVSRSQHLRPLEKRFAQLWAKEVRVINMTQGQKRSRFIARHFQA